MHQTVIVAIGYCVVQASWSPWIKYWTALAATLASCWALYEFIVRRFRATRLNLGMKPQRTVASSTLAGEKRSAVV